jgi:hypothetical protein
MYIKGLNITYPITYRIVKYLLDIIYGLCLAVCIAYIANSIVLPLIHRLVICLKNIFNGILCMSGDNKKNPDIGGSDNKNSTPEPEKPNPDYDKATHTGSKKKRIKTQMTLKKLIPFSAQWKKKANNGDPLDGLDSYYENYTNFFEAMNKSYVEQAKNSFNLPKIIREYRDYVSSQDKQSLNNLVNNKIVKQHLDTKTTVEEFWNTRLELNEQQWEVRKSILKIFYDNSKTIQSSHLGGKNSLKSKELRQELQLFTDNTRNDYKIKKSIIIDQIHKKDTWDTFQKQLNNQNLSLYNVYDEIEYPH